MKCSNERPRRVGMDSCGNWCGHWICKSGRSSDRRTSFLQRKNVCITMQVIQPSSKLWTTCSFELHKIQLTYIFIQWGTQCSSHETLGGAPATNCRKNNLTSWFAGIGGCSILRTDVNHATQMRQGMPSSLPFTFPPATEGGWEERGGLLVGVWD